MKRRGINKEFWWGNYR